MSCNISLASVSAPATTYAFTPTGGVLHYVAIRALNSGGASPYSSEVSFSVPGFAQPVNQSSPVGTAISTLNLSVSEPDGDPLGFTHTGLPTGLSLHPSTGQITGTPSAAGTYNVTVFVTDGLATVQRSFVWTITSAQADTQPPTLTITSHTSGQTVTSANVTISGTATDANRGGRGITSVTVNGVSTGATATGSNTANWSRGVTLTSGSNTITVEATDGAGNVSMQQLTLNANLSIAPVTSATLIANVASPVTTGTTISFTAAGSGGVAPRQYKFLVAQGGGAGQTVQNWSTSSSYTWTPTTAASYTVSVWVRSAGVTADAAQASAQVAYTINAPAPNPVTSASLSASLASPQNTGTPITLTAGASGGVSPRQYKFLVAQGGGAAQTVQNWSTSSMYTWTPTTAASYTVSVWVRSAGVTADVAQASAQVAYTINTPPPSPVTSATLSANRTSPQNTGTAVTFTAGASGGVGPRQYKFLVAQGGGAAQVVQNWSTTSTYTWTPTTAATYTVSVWARSAGVTTDAPQASAQVSFVVATPPSAPTVSVMPATPSSGSGSTQTFSLQYVDSVSANNIASAWVYFTATFSTNAANSCMAYYSKSNATLYLLDDSGTQWMPGTLGTGETLQNRQCSIALAGSSVSLSGQTLTLNLPMTFTGAFAGAKNVHLYGANAAGVNSGWQDRGDWTVTAPPPPSAPAAPIVGATAVSPSSGSGATQTFALQYSDSSGASNLVTTWVWFNAAFGSSAANSCMAYYNRPAGTLHLLNDAGTEWMPGTLGASTTLRNSQCSVVLGSSSVALSGTSLTLNLAMTFSASYAGAKNVYLYAANASANSGWQDRGDWTVAGSSGPPTPTPGSVTAISVSPSSGAGTSQTFALQYGDSNAANQLATAWAWFSGSFGSSANSCMVYYDQRTTTLNFLNDAGTAWIEGRLGTNAVLQNAQCAVALQASSVSLSGTTLTMNLAMTFKTGYAGAKNVYSYAANVAGVNSGWHDRGDWTVPSSAPSAPAPTPPAPAAGVSAVSATPSSGSGSAQVFSLAYSDSSGAANLATAWVWFTPDFGTEPVRSCMAYYDRRVNTLYLLSNDGNEWMPGVLGGEGILANRQCSIALTSSSVGISGTNMTLNLAMTFTHYSGSKSIYMYADNASGSKSGWQNRGSWVVPNY